MPWCSAAPRSGLLAANWQDTTRAVLSKSDAAFKCSAAGFGPNVIADKNHYRD
jgi:hypothetical protein